MTKKHIESTSENPGDLFSARFDNLFDTESFWPGFCIKHSKVLLILVIFIMPLTAFSKGTVNIVADTVIHHEQSGQVQYSGNVEVTQNNLTLVCDTLTFTREDAKATILAQGAPLKFQHVENEQTIKGTGNKVLYHVKEELLEVSGNTLKIKSTGPNGNFDVDAKRLDYDLKAKSLIILGQPVMITERDTAEPFQLKANRIDYDLDKSVLLATGSPLHFKKAGKKPLSGTAQQGRYDINAENLILSGKARLVQEGSSFISKRIVYDQKSKKILSGKIAQSSDRVHTIINLDD